MHRVAVTVALIFSFPIAALSKDLAVCGASEGYGYYPKSGLMASSDAAGNGIRTKFLKASSP
jgi:hypothetical protein